MSPWRPPECDFYRPAKIKAGPIPDQSLRAASKTDGLAPMTERRNAVSDSQPLPTLQALVEAALTLADEHGRWDLAIHLNQALVALDGAGRMPPETARHDLGWSSDHSPQLQ